MEGPNAKNIRGKATRSNLVVYKDLLVMRKTLVEIFVGVTSDAMEARQVTVDRTLNPIFE